MEKPIILIADGQEEFRSALADMLRDSFRVCQAADGRQAQAMLEDIRPDVLVVDLIMPELDGISLLDWVREQGLNPKIMAVTMLVNDFVQWNLGRLQVDYLMQKPCNMRALTQRIRDLSQQETEEVTEKTVTGMLMELGVPAGLDGYGYLQNAIPLYARDPRQALTKELYCAVGQTCQVSAVQVERSIRTATKKAWLQRNDHVWKRYFPSDTAGQLRCPTNGEFISRLAGHLMLQPAQRTIK